MSVFYPNLARQIEEFLREDVGLGDLTSEAIFPPSQQAEAQFIAKESFICAGMATVAAQVFEFCGVERISQAREDGSRVQKGEIIFAAEGPVLQLLRAERLALNLVQRLCGIATLTYEFVSKVAGTKARVVDTRKTTPGLRVLEKYAVRAGGGHNHRFSLADGILIKDNHIAACGGSIKKAVERVQTRCPHTLKVEVETETLEQVQEALECRADIIMLDNMPPSAMAKAVSLVAGRALVEASGGVSLENIAEISRTGVDIISVGALTHSARACDISMKIGGRYQVTGVR